MSELMVLLIAPFVGSFLGLVADRLPRGEGVVWGRSRCESCGRALGPGDLVPVLSFVRLRGRAGCCGAPIPWALPAIELAALAVAASAAWAADGARFWAGLGLGWTLLCLAWIDARTLRLPDALTLPLGAAGLLLGFAGVLGPLPAQVVGAVLGFGLLAALDAAYRRLRGRPGVGRGDAKLLGAVGAWLGPGGLGPTVLVAALVGLAAAVLAPGGARRDARIAFGPCLALGAWVVWLVEPRLLAHPRGLSAGGAGSPGPPARRPEARPRPARGWAPPKGRRRSRTSDWPR